MNLKDRIIGMSRPIIFLCAGGAIVAVLIVLKCVSDVAVLRKEESLEQTIRQMEPAVANARAISAKRDELRRTLNEFSGWNKSRLALSDVLAKALDLRLPTMAIDRLVAQDRFYLGKSDPDLDYPPRYRECRLVIGGLVVGADADQVTHTYTRSISSSNCLGSVFSSIKNPGLERKRVSEGDPVTFRFAIECFTKTRAIDGEQTQ